MKRPKLTLQTLNWPVVWTAIVYGIVIATVIMMAVVSLSGCADLDYGDLHWSRWGNWKGKGVYFSEDVCDPNGCSHVRIFIFGPDINHDELVGKAFEGAAKGLK